jgi:hypothetical protein
MDTNAAAANLGTTPKRLRQFLRSPESTFAAVGSGGRYDFTTADLAAMAPRFSAWNGSASRVPTPAPVDVPARTSRTQWEIDREVWDEEGPVVIEDIRQPVVRRRVQRIAEAREARLNERLLAVGLHITQMTSRAGRPVRTWLRAPGCAFPMGPSCGCLDFVHHAGSQNAPCGSFSAAVMLG